ncbi:MAG: nitroreductase family protein [Ilumatobacteraceae bacterium]
MAETDETVRAALYGLMSTQRAVRRLRPDPIPDDVLQRVLQAAAWAPTGGNVQPWRIIVVRDPEVKAKLADVYRPQWEAYAVGVRSRLEGQPGFDASALDRTAIAGDHLAAHLHEAPAILVVCFDPRRLAVTDAGQDRVSVVGGGSIYPAVQNLLLACVAEGLGCTLTTLHCLDEPAVLEALAIPAPWATAAMIPIGYPVGKGHGPISRRPLSELVYADTFRTPFEEAGPDA